MILEYFWLTLFILASIGSSVAFAVKDHTSENYGDPDPAPWFLAALGASSIAFIMSWDAVGAHILKTVLTWLPQYGTNIASFTGYGIVAIVGVMAIVGIPILGASLTYMSRTPRTAEKTL